MQSRAYRVAFTAYTAALLIFVCIAIREQFEYLRLSALFSGTAVRSHAALKADSNPCPLPFTNTLPEDVKLTGTLVRAGGLSHEGYGSFLQRMKASIILSMALNKTLLLAEEIRSEHNYSTTAQINEAYGYTFMEKQSVNCTSKQMCNLQHQHEAAVLDTACRAMYGGGSSKDHYRSMPAADLVSWLSSYRANHSCSNVYHTKVQLPGTYYVEDYERFNDCIQPWLSKTFHRMFKQRGYHLPATWQIDTPKIRVGIHIRWGDLASVNVSRLNSRSIQLTDIRSCVEKLRRTGKLFKYYVFMKDHSESLLAQLSFNHTVVDSGDDLYDMFVYSHMGVYIQGASSYSVTASLINPNKMVITNEASSAKYRFDYFQVNRVYSIGGDAYVDHLRTREKL